VGCRGHMVVGFTTTVPVQSVPINIKIQKFKPCSWQGVFDTTLRDKVCQWLTTGQTTRYSCFLHQ